MKKSSKILGSIALSAALVMGTAAPAFADTLSNPEGASKQSELNSTQDAVETQSAQIKGGAAVKNGSSVVPESNSTFNGTGASTVVNISTYTSQISVTVPLKLALALDTAGGEGYAPAPGKYYIQNNSKNNVTVSGAKYEIAKSGETNYKPYTFGAAALGTGANAAAAIGGTLQGTQVGSLFVKLTPGSLDTDSNFTAGTGAVLDLKGTSESNVTGTQDLDWTIAAGGQQALKVEASSSVLKNAPASVTDVAGITYTVKVATNS